MHIRQLSIYVARKANEIVIILLYVDDIVIASTTFTILMEIKQSFCNKYEMKDLGTLERYLGMHINTTKDYISIDQSEYTVQLLKKYQSYLTSKRHRNTPMDTTLHVSKDEQMTEKQQYFCNIFPYQNIIGGLLYLAIHTRPDIAFAVNTLSRFNNSPTYTACHAVIRVLEYLRDNTHYAIKYNSKDLNFHMYSDSGWAANVDNRRSTCGHVVYMGNGPISWQSKLQTVVATSSMEAEYMGAYYAVQDCCWIKGVMNELGFNSNDPTPFYLDSKSAIDLAKNPIYHKRSKHIHIKYHWLRQKVEDKTVTLNHIKTDKMIADIFTKPLAYAEFAKYRDSLIHKI